MSPTKIQLIPVSWRPFPALLGPEPAGIHADQMFSGVPTDVITRVLLPRALSREKRQRARWGSGGWYQVWQYRSFLFFPARCSKAVDKTQLEERNGVFYFVNDTNPLTGTFTPFYENGQKEVEVNYVDGKPQGLGTSWYENGQKKSEASYVDGKEQGLLTNWYENGQKKSESNYVDGKPQGLGTAWHENGQKRVEINYVDGKQQGLVTNWYESGQKQAEANMVDGKQQGLTIGWHENGQRSASEWHENGQSKSFVNGAELQHVGMFIYLANSTTPFTGTSLSFYENGQRKEEMNYADGKAHGLAIGWYESGQKKSEVKFANGQGPVMTKWYENGQKEFERNKQGKMTSWDESGRKTFEMN